MCAEPSLFLLSTYESGCLCEICIQIAFKVALKLTYLFLSRTKLHKVKKYKVMEKQPGPLQTY